MATIQKACNTSVSVKNTGKTCDSAMLATAMLLMVHPSVEWDLEELEDPEAWASNLIHQRKLFPLFGNEAPINAITNSNETDVIATLDDGQQVFIRFGIYNKMFETIKGGLCYAKSLLSFLGSGFKVIEIDQIGQMMFAKKSNGKYSGLTTSFISPASPAMADFRNPYKNRFNVSYTPTELVNNGVVMTGGEAFLGMTGLIDVYLTEEAVATVAGVTIGVKTECGDTDIVTDFPTEFALAGNFTIEHATTHAPITITGRVVTGDSIALAATLVSGQSYIVRATAPTAWKTNGITGYDGSAGFDGSITIAVP